MRSSALGEVEQTTGLPANVHLDGNGNLDIVALGAAMSIAGVWVYAWQS